jgi:hypothetical protein
MTSPSSLLGATALLLAVVAGALAETPAADPPGPCVADVARFCKDVARGEGRMRTCLLAHAKDLAPACRTRLEAASVADDPAAPGVGPPALRDCRQDLRTHCASVEAGDGRLRDCLDAHARDLTPRCKAALARPRDTQPAR